MDDTIIKLRFSVIFNFDFCPLAFSLISLVLIGLVSFNVATSFNILVILVFYWFSNYWSVYLKRVNTIYQDADKAKDTFKQYHQIVK